MGSITGDDGKMLTFKHHITLGEYGKVLEDYRSLVFTLTGEIPTYQDFTAFLLREGYVTAD